MSSFTPINTPAGKRKRTHSDANGRSIDSVLDKRQKTEMDKADEYDSDVISVHTSVHSEAEGEGAKQDMVASATAPATSTPITPAKEPTSDPSPASDVPNPTRTPAKLPSTEGVASSGFKFNMPAPATKKPGSDPGAASYVSQPTKTPAKPVSAGGVASMPTPTTLKGPTKPGDNMPTKIKDAAPAPADDSEEQSGKKRKRSQKETDANPTPKKSKKKDKNAPPNPSSLKSTYTKRMQALNEKVRKEAEKKEEDGEESDPDSSDDSSDDSEPEGLNISNEGLFREEIITAIAAVTESIRYDSDPVRGCQFSIIDGENLNKWVRGVDSPQRVGRPRRVFYFPYVYNYPKEEKEDAKKAQEKAGPRLPFSMEKPPATPKKVKGASKEASSKGSEGETELKGSEGESADNEPSEASSASAKDTDNSEDQRPHWILFVVHVPPMVGGPPEPNTAGMPRIDVYDSAPELLREGVAQDDVEDHVKTIVESLCWYSGQAHHHSPSVNFMKMRYVPSPAQRDTESMKVREKKFKAKSNEEIEVQTAEASSSIHTILSAWAHALHLEVNPNFDFTAKNSRLAILDFYTKAVELINHVIAGHAGSDLIYLFLAGYRYIIATNEEVPESQRFSRNEDIRSAAHVRQRYDQVLQRENWMATL
ncbi:hypothetical protein NA57DRAFT_72516 [Rhizodiscina lignyota]|uniref:Uncharacterized protein n=1 Tax=Rhizodiscina lignyota TaxID=1504668 RepID=A0A9P4MAR9_9PEZI|nr:hypothetical protein NA57DRAFT_72516 [Rhizodiscina lignyota]